MTLQKFVNRELRKINKWPDDNRLSSYVSKANYAIFLFPSNEFNDFIKFTLDYKPLNCVNNVKYLGVLVDSTLRNHM